MPADVSEIDQYIADAPTEMQPVLHDLRAMMREQLPGTTEKISSSGCPLCTQQVQRAAGIAWRKKGRMRCILASGVLDANAERLGSLRSGRLCVEWRAPNR